MPRSSFTQMFEQYQRDMSAHFEQSMGWNAANIAAMGITNIYLIDASHFDRLDQWMSWNGRYTPIKELTDEQLSEAIQLAKQKTSCGGQEAKIISLQKEKASRTAARQLMVIEENRYSRRMKKKDYPAKKGRKK